MSPKKNTKQGKNGFWNWFLTPSGLISLLSFILAMFLARKPIADLFKSPKQLYDQETFEQGDIKSPKLQPYTILEVTPKVNYTLVKGESQVEGIKVTNLRTRVVVPIIIGGKVLLMPTTDLYKGVELFYPLFKECVSEKLKIVAKGDRVYVSTEFKDFKSEEVIGFIDYNHWNLYKNVKVNYNYDDERFQVWDKQGYIVFSIQFQKEGNLEALTIGGYFISPSSIFISKNIIKYDSTSDKCISKSDSNWNKKAELEISKINSIISPR